MSLIGQGGGSESHRETQSCLLGTRRGESRAGLPAFSTLTSEGLGHPSPPPDPSEDTASPSSPGPRGPPSGTKLPRRPVPSAAGAVIPWVQTPSRSRPSCRCPLCPPGGAHGGRDQALPQGRTAGWAPGGNRSERSRLPVPAPSLARSFSPRDGCAPGRGGRGSHLVPWSNPAQRRGASVSAPGLGGPPDLPACHVPAFRPSGLGSRGPGPPASLGAEV